MTEAATNPIVLTVLDGTMPQRTQSPGRPGAHRIDQETEQELPGRPVWGLAPTNTSLSMGPTLVDEPVPIVGQPSHFERALMHLLAHPVTLTPHQGRVHVQVELDRTPTTDDIISVRRPRKPGRGPRSSRPSQSYSGRAGVRPETMIRTTLTLTCASATARDRLAQALSRG